MRVRRARRADHARRSNGGDAREAFSVGVGLASIASAWPSHAVRALEGVHHARVQAILWPPAISASSAPDSRRLYDLEQPHAEPLRRGAKLGGGAGEMVAIGPLGRRGACRKRRSSCRRCSSCSEHMPRRTKGAGDLRPWRTGWQSAYRALHSRSVRAHASWRDRVRPTPPRRSSSWVGWVSLRSAYGPCRHVRGRERQRFSHIANFVWSVARPSSAS